MAAVMVTTKMTAPAIPVAVFRLRDKLMKGHMPRRYVRATLWVKIAAKKMVSR